ncbi:MAG: CPBP family intramembrane glutamic endopeptidase [Desulfovibrionaceae bacterium]
MDHGPKSRPALYATIALCTIPFVLNDFADPVLRDFPSWALLDYALRILALAGLALAAPALGFSRRDLRLVPADGRRTIIYALALSLGAVLLDQIAAPALASLIPGWDLPGMPAYPGPAWESVDLTFGLALVAVSEELLFRGAVPAAMRRLGWPPGAVMAGACALFGIIHWSNGPAAILVTGLIGALFLCSAQRTGSLVPAIIAHYVVNLLAFA